jgi:hypothetical protein
VTPYVIDPDAQAELVEAAMHYDDQRPGRGLRFANAVEAAIAAAVRAPRAAPLLQFVPKERGLILRQRTVRRFPYLVIYRDDPVLRVIAIAHGKRRPGYWLSRLSNRRF